MQFNFDDISILQNILKNCGDNYYDAFIRYLHGKNVNHRICFIMHKTLFHSYVKWLFSVLDSLRESVDISLYGTFRSKCFSAYAAILTEVYFSVHNEVKIARRKLLSFNNITPEENIEHAFSENNIPMVIVSSNFYIPYFSVLLESIIENSSSENNYDIIVLQNEQIESSNKMVVDQMLKDHPNFSVRYFDYSRYMHLAKNYALTSSIAGAGAEASFFRMAIPYVMKNYDKMIVTDADMVFLKDIADLYSTDIGSCLIAGVIDNCTIGRLNGATPGRMEYYKDLGVHDVYKCVNTGVMVWNLDEFRKTFSQEETFNYITSQSFKVGEQDALNVMVGDRFYYLDPRWDTYALGGDYNRVYSFAPIDIDFGLQAAREDPFVVHYVGRETAKPKPWSNPEIDFASYFWKYARKSPFYEVIIYRMICGIVQRDLSSGEKKLRNQIKNGSISSAKSFQKKVKEKGKQVLLAAKSKFPFLTSSINAVFRFKKKWCFAKLQKTIPTRKNTVLFSSFAGKSYSCNPKAIYEAMIANPKYSDFKYVWAFKDPSKYIFLSENRNTSVVKYGSKQYEKACCYSQYWVNNYTMPEYIWPKKDQIYIHTWHGKPIKKIGCDTNGDLDIWNKKGDLLRRYKNDAKKMTYLLSSSEFYGNCMTRAFRLSKRQQAELLVPAGYARNRFLFEYTDEDVLFIKKRLHISPDKKVILYAPTWRPHNYTPGNGFEYDDPIDFTMLQKALGDEYVILFRSHHMTNITHEESNVICVNSWEDVNLIYIVSDLMISDYSGTIFDYANLKRPMVFYMYDREAYEKNPGVYVPLDELPGPIVTNEHDLPSAIKDSLNNFVYDEKYQQFNKKYNPYEGIDCVDNILDKYFKVDDV